LLFSAGVSQAQIPALPHIPEGIPSAVQSALQPRLVPLQSRIEGLVASGKHLNQHCTHFEVGSSLEQECISEKQQWIAQRRELQKDADTLQAHIGMIAQLVAQDQKLTRDIEGNLQSIEDLGFKHRAEEFEEWNKLSEEAKKDFAEKVQEQAVDLLADKFEEGILSGVKGISQARAAQWTAMLQKGNPKPVAVIAAVQRMSTTETRVQLTADAGILTTFLKSGYAGWNAETREQLLTVALDNVCEGVAVEALSAQCKVFRSEAKVLSAEVYYGAATYIARQQVDALTKLSEDQLKGLAARNKVLQQQVQDRSEVRGKINLLLSE
jgi:prefoldin subunit 5